MVACHCQVKPWEKCRVKILVVDKTILIWSNCLHEGGLDNCLQLYKAVWVIPPCGHFKGFFGLVRILFLKSSLFIPTKCNLMKGHAYLFLLKFTKWLRYCFISPSRMACTKGRFCPLSFHRSHALLYGVDNWMGDHHCGCQACIVVHQSCVSPL